MIKIKPRDWDLGNISPKASNSMENQNQFIKIESRQQKSDKNENAISENVYTQDRDWGFRRSLRSLPNQVRSASRWSPGRPTDAPLLGTRDESGTRRDLLKLPRKIPFSSMIWGSRTEKETRLQRGLGSPIWSVTVGFVGVRSSRSVKRLQRIR